MRCFFCNNRAKGKVKSTIPFAYRPDYTFFTCDEHVELAKAFINKNNEYNIKHLDETYRIDWEKIKNKLDNSSKEKENKGDRGKNSKIQRKK